MHQCNGICKGFTMTLVKVNPTIIKNSTTLVLQLDSRAQHRAADKQNSKKGRSWRGAVGYFLLTLRTLIKTAPNPEVTMENRIKCLSFRKSGIRGTPGKRDEI